MRSRRRADAPVPEWRPGGAAGPGDAAVGRAKHFVLPDGQAPASLEHRRHVNAPTALQVPGDLDVADKGYVDLRQRPSGAVIRVDHVQRAVVDGEIVVGNVHPPVEGAGRVVVHPHTLAVVVGAAVGTGPGAPGDAVSGRPKADALTAAAGRQVAGEPHAQARVVHHDRVAEVSPVAGTKRLASVPGGPVISRV